MSLIITYSRDASTSRDPWPSAGINIVKDIVNGIFNGIFNSIFNSIFNNIFNDILNCIEINNDNKRTGRIVYFKTTDKTSILLNVDPIPRFATNGLMNDPPDALCQ